MLADNFDWPRSPAETTRRLAPTAEVELRVARNRNPDVSHRVARTEAQGLANVSLCLVGATNQDLTNSDIGMGEGEISIQVQRVLTFGDALCRAPGRRRRNSRQESNRTVTEACFKTSAGSGRGRQRPEQVDWSNPPRRRTMTVVSAQRTAGGGRVGVWRGGVRPSVSVSAPFVRRCLSGSAIAPFPHPSHRTQQADFPHCALGQDFTPSPTARRAQVVSDV